MTTVRKTLAELRARPPKLSPAKARAFDAITDADIERAAAEDPDAALLDDEQLDRMAASRLVRQTRERTGLSQNQFAKRFHIHPSRVKDWEQGRYRPDAMARAYLKIIREAPDMVLKLLDAPK